MVPEEDSNYSHITMIFNNNLDLIYILPYQPAPGLF